MTIWGFNWLLAMILGMLCELYRWLTGELSVGQQVYWEWVSRWHQKSSFRRMSLIDALMLRFIVMSFVSGFLAKYTVNFGVSLIIKLHLISPMSSAIALFACVCFLATTGWKHITRFEYSWALGLLLCLLVMNFTKGFAQ